MKFVTFVFGTWQTGGGHFSPIGGYHAGKDMVLILDVARFKYPPHWVPLTFLWDAMNTIDKDTGLYRGYVHEPALYFLICLHNAQFCGIFFIRTLY